MSDLISRQDAIDALESMSANYSGKGREWHPHIDACMAELMMLPSAQHTAVWELDEQQEHVEKTWHCSNCGYRAWGSYEKTDFCGGCGADMRGKTDD